MISLHSFHIPVMGVGYTIDTPIKVAKYGIDSCISLVQDHVLEKAREMYCKKYKFPYRPIKKTEKEFRSKRITAYLNMVNKIVQLEFDKLLKDDDEQRKYFEMLPDTSSVKQKYMLFKDLAVERNYDLEEVLTSIKAGSIDVNIMSKLDRLDEKNGIGDALAALKGYAESELSSSIVFSAGINPRLLASVEQYPDFFPSEGNAPKKKVILKVSDFRSASIQANMLVKKGIWPHEFRIESGLNCGGHAFATQGHLLGPVLEQFKNNKGQLYTDLRKTYLNALIERNIEEWLPCMFLVSVQGGIGTAQEQQQLQQQYNIDKTGWGSPFLLVPEATSVDQETLKKLSDAEEDDIYLSNSSPLGVTYNNLRTSEAEAVRLKRIEKGKPGSPCFRKHVAVNTEFGKPLCIASREYQKKKIQELSVQQLPPQEYKEQFNRITEKECICDGLAVSYYRLYDIPDKENSNAVSICPGPNIAYYGQIYSLAEMIDHIYGRKFLIKKERPHMFLKELELYTNYFKDELKKVSPDNTKAIKYLEGFRTNLIEGIHYYEQLFKEQVAQTHVVKQTILNALNTCKVTITQ